MLTAASKKKSRSASGIKKNLQVSFAKDNQRLIFDEGTPKNWATFFGFNIFPENLESSKKQGPFYANLNDTVNDVDEFHNIFTTPATERPGLLFFNKNNEISLLHHVTTHIPLNEDTKDYDLTVCGISHVDFWKSHSQLDANAHDLLRKVTIDVPFKLSSEHTLEKFNIIFENWNKAITAPPENEVENDPSSISTATSDTPQAPANQQPVTPSAEEQAILYTLLVPDSAVTVDTSFHAPPPQNSTVLFNDDDSILDEAEYDDEGYPLKLPAKYPIDLFEIDKGDRTYDILPVLICPRLLICDLLKHMEKSCTDDEEPVNSFPPNLVYKLAKISAKDKLFGSAFTEYPFKPDRKAAQHYISYLAGIKVFCSAAQKKLLPKFRLIPCEDKEHGTSLHKWTLRLYNLDRFPHTTLDPDSDSHLSSRKQNPGGNKSSKSSESDSDDDDMKPPAYRRFTPKGRNNRFSNYSSNNRNRPSSEPPTSNRNRDRRPKSKNYDKQPTPQPNKNHKGKGSSCKDETSGDDYHSDHSSSSSNDSHHDDRVGNSGTSRRRRSNRQSRNRSRSPSPDNEDDRHRQSHSHRSSSRSRSERRSLEALVSSQANIQQFLLATTQSQSQSNKSKSLFDNLPEDSQRVLCRGSALEDNSDEISIPYPTCANLFGVAIRAKATFTLNAILSNSYCRGTFQTGHLTAITIRGPIWETPVEPSGLTALAIFPFNKKRGNQNIELAAILKAGHDNHLGNAEVDHMVNKDLYIPYTYDDIHIQLDTMVNVLSCLFGPNALITRAYQSNLKFHKENFVLIADLLSVDKFVGAKIVYAYDTAMQLVFRQLACPSTPLPSIKITNLHSAFLQTHNEIITRRLSAVTLPKCVVDLKAKENRQKNSAAGDDERPPPKKKPKKDESKDSPLPTPPKDTSTPPTEPAINPRFNKKWEVPNEKYRDLHQVARSTPSHVNKSNRTISFCLGYHVRGKCVRGTACNLSHDDPRDVDKEVEFSNFIKPFQSA